MDRLHPSQLKLLVMLTWLAFGIANLSAGEMDKPTNTVGFANCFGELQFTGHLGSIRLGRDDIYDLYYQYSSFRNANSPHLGRGFFVPLLESTLIDRDHFIQVTTLGGATEFLYRLAHDPNSYISLNGKNQAKKKGGDTFVRLSSDGFQLEYRRGRLTRFKTPRGNEVTLEYDGQICRTVRGSSGAVVVAFAELNAQQATLATGEGRFEIAFQNYPQTQDPEEAALGIIPVDERSAQSILWPNGAKSEFDYAVDPERREIAMTMKYAGQGVTFVWNSVNGYIRSAGTVLYNVSPLSRNWDLSQERIVAGSYRIDRKYPNGSWKSYWQDEDKGLIEESSSDEALVRTHLIKNRGPSFHLIKKRERAVDHGENELGYETFYRAFYDTEGRLLRQVQDGVLTHHLRPGDQLAKGTIQAEDNIVQYDENGRVYYSRFDGIETHRRFLEGDICRELKRYPWDEVVLRFVGPTGQPVPFPPGETFPEAVQN